MSKIHTICEIANYWHGDEGLLVETIEQAAACQVDFLKIQTPDAERLGNPWKHQKKRIKSCEIMDNKLKEVKEQCDTLGVKLLATANHVSSVELLQKKDVSNIKIASGQLHPLLVGAIREHKWERVFVSTGMLDNIQTLNLITDLFDCCNELIVMHCVSLYPTYDTEVNINRLDSLNDFFRSGQRKITLGYSDHCMDDLACFLAVGKGARYLEKHFRVEGSFGPTSEIALDPDQMGNFVGLCKRMSLMQGDGLLPMQSRERASFDHYKTRYVI